MIKISFLGANSMTLSIYIDYLITFMRIFVIGYLYKIYGWYDKYKFILFVIGNTDYYTRTCYYLENILIFILYFLNNLYLSKV